MTATYVQAPTPTISTLERRTWTKVDHGDGVSMEMETETEMGDGNGDGNGHGACACGAD